jgi:hypothetical protein
MFDGGYRRNCKCCFYISAVNPPYNLMIIPLQAVPTARDITIMEPCLCSNVSCSCLVNVILLTMYNRLPEVITFA